MGPGSRGGQQRVMHLCQKAEARARIRDAVRALVAQGGDGPALDYVSSNPPDPGTEVARHRRDVAVAAQETLHDRLVAR